MYATCIKADSKERLIDDVFRIENLSAKKRCNSIIFLLLYNFSSPIQFSADANVFSLQL